MTKYFKSYFNFCGLVQFHFCKFLGLDPYKGHERLLNYNRIIHYQQVNNMNTSSIWSDLVPEKDGVKSSINDIAISPGNFCVNIDILGKSS